MPDLLRIEGLRAGYGEAVVLPDLSLHLPESQVLALLGRNGTGKWPEFYPDSLGPVVVGAGTAYGHGDVQSGLRINLEFISANSHRRIGPDDVAWIIHTSGTDM